MPPAVLAEHQVAARQPDILGPQNLIRRVMLEHSMLMNASLVREGVFADHRLVARNRHARDARDQARRGVEAVGLNLSGRIEEGRARLQRHHDFFE